MGDVPKLISNALIRFIFSHGRRIGGLKSCSICHSAGRRRSWFMTTEALQAMEIIHLDP
jgi:hypothetical protein